MTSHVPGSKSNLHYLFWRNSVSLGTYKTYFLPKNKSCHINVKKAARVNRHDECDGSSNPRDFLVIPTNPHTSCFLFHISHIYFPRSDHHRSKTRDGMTKQSDGALPLSDLFSTSVFIFRNHARHKARALFIVSPPGLEVPLLSSFFPVEGWTNFKVKCSQGNLSKKRNESETGRAGASEFS